MLKRVSVSFIIVIFAVIICIGCNSEKGFEKRLKVYTSFYVMYDFTKKVGGDLLNIEMLCTAGMEPHDFEPSVNDIINLERANLLIYSGAGMEPWVDKVKSSIRNKNLIFIEASTGIERLDKMNSKNVDPHIWLSPKNAKKECENIKNALIEADPSNKDKYEYNYEICGKRFDELDIDYKSKLSSLSQRSIVVAHKAYSYLCNDYGLEQMALEGLAEHSEPDPATMTQIINYCRDKNISTIFFEDAVNSKTVETVAKETNAKTAVLSPLENLSEAQIEQGEDYFSIMRKNLQALEEALKNDESNNRS